MSTALDEDTRRTLDEGREAAGAMLRAAQKDLQKVFIVFLIGFLGTFYALRWFVWDFLKGVTEAQMDAATQGTYEIIAQTPFDVLLLQAKISLTVGVIFGLPIFVYFARDALRDRGYWPQSPVAPWKLAVLFVLIVVLFTGGVAYGYLVFFPFMFAFLAGNAISAGFAPTYSIVMWAQFIFLLTLSFGLAAQMPLAITGLSYAEIVPYEFFRDKWRHAVVFIFAFGALFSPPDPFTQIMWAVPLLVLYGVSLYLAKAVVTMRRGSEQIDFRRTVLTRWNVLAGGALAGGALVYGFYAYGGVSVVNGYLVQLGSDYRMFPPGTTLSVAPAVAVGIYAALAAAVGVVCALLYVVYVELQGVAVEPDVGNPAGIDLSKLDEAGVRAAPPEAFAPLSEGDVVELANLAMQAEEHAKAQALLERFDEVHEGSADEGGDGATGGSSASVAVGTWAETASNLRELLALGASRVDWSGRLRRAWNLPLIAAVVGFAAIYLPSEGYLPGATLPPLPVAPIVAAVALGASLAVVAAVTYALRAAYRAALDPATVDLSVLTAEEIRNAPARAFATRTEYETERAAGRTLNRGDPDAAEAIFDRYDEAVAAREAPSDPEERGELQDRTSRATGTFLSELTEGERDEDDIGGYYTDIAFIVDSITSRAFRIIAVFGGVLATTFAWLYTGGMGRVFEQFLSQLPPSVTPDENITVVALHPVEALIFEVKFSTLIAALVVVPLLAYYAWPALRERGFVRGHQRVIFLWTGALTVGLLGGFVLGYMYAAPYIISFLVADAVTAEMIIAYRITNFFWLIFFTTAGIGLLADVPVLMVLLNTAGVSYWSMRGRWREVTVAVLTFAALFTPADIVTMFLVTIPLMAAYGVGIGVLFVLTLGGRRDLSRPRGVTEG
ncbi:MAG: twin-arginine translocase subunit TatC [Halobacteriota archaeon]